jgi:hypothetical protein
MSETKKKPNVNKWGDPIVRRAYELPESLFSKMAARAKEKRTSNTKVLIEALENLLEEQSN